MDSLQPLFNYLVPATGTVSGFNIQQDFSTPYKKDFGQLTIDASEFHPYGVYVDNTSSSYPLTITILETGHKIVIPAGRVKHSPYPGPMKHSVTVQSSSAVPGTGNAVVTFVDFPVMPFESAAESGVPTGQSGHGTVDATGTQIVVPAGEYTAHTTIQNTDGANILYLSFANPATALDIKLQPGQAITFPSNGFANAIYGRSSGVTTAFAFIGA